MFRAALLQLGDPGPLRQALLELTRTYNPVTNASLLTPGTRYRVLELLEQGDPNGARQLLEGALAQYLESGQPPAPAEGSP
jgi:hypothetical protein